MKATSEGVFIITNFITKLTCARYFNKFMYIDFKNLSSNRIKTILFKNKYNNLYSVNNELAMKLNVSEFHFVHPVVFQYNYYIKPVTTQQTMRTEGVIIFSLFVML
jgi:hypothetical protein